MIDWQGEVNAVETPIERTLKDALDQCKTWNHCIVLYIEEIDEDKECVGWINTVPSTVLNDVKLLEAVKFCMLQRWQDRHVEES